MDSPSGLFEWCNKSQPRNRFECFGIFELDRSTQGIGDADAPDRTLSAGFEGYRHGYR
jgi:hypothetical protein